MRRIYAYPCQDTPQQVVVVRFPATGDPKLARRRRKQKEIITDLDACPSQSWIGGEWKSCGAVGLLLFCSVYTLSEPLLSFYQCKKKSRFKFALSRTDESGIRTHYKIWLATRQYLSAIRLLTEGCPTRIQFKDESCNSWMPCQGLSLTSGLLSVLKPEDRDTGRL